MSENITNNPSVPTQVVAEVKFPRFVNNLGIIPTSYKDSMSYYETLAWLCKYLEETVIPTVNQNGNAVQELQGLYIQLNDYVTHYFDNLDVQTEINNKLDEMVQSGSLQDVLSVYFNSLENTYNQRYIEMQTQTNARYNQLQDEMSLLTNSVNSQISTLDEKIVSSASGSPAGTYATVSALTTADPNHSKIYLVLENGNWYYYNTSSSQWTSGGTYQASSLGDSVIDFNNFNSRVSNALNIYIPEYTVIEGSYLSVTAGIASSEYFNRTSPILLKPNSKVYVKSTVTHSVTAIGVVDSDSSNGYPAVIGTDTAQSLYQYKNTSNVNQYVSVSYAVAGNFSIYIVDGESLDYDIVKNNTDLHTGITENYYLNASGSPRSANHTDISPYIELSPNYNYRLVSSTSFNKGVDVRSYAFYNSNKQIISATQQPNQLYIDLTIPANTKYLRFSMTKTSDYYLLVNKKSFTDETLDFIINYNDTSISNNSVGLSDSVIFYGDSLTNGQTYTSASQSYKNYYNYRYFLKKLMNLDNISTIARNGATTETWWNNYNSQIIYSDSLYFVWLGTNDILTDTVANDCPGNDYNNYLETATGYFGKILGKISSLNRNKIVLINNFATVGTLSTNNKVISDLATKFNCILIDISKADTGNTNYHTSYNNYVDNVHFNSTGYNYVANYVFNELNKAIKGSNKLEMYKATT